MNNRNMPINGQLKATSNRGTPLNSPSKKRQISTPNNGKFSNSNATTAVNKKINKFSEQPIDKCEKDTEKKKEISKTAAQENNNSVLNTAFRSASMLNLSTNANAMVVSPNRIKSKSTMLNACYTPSSLYGSNSKITPRKGPHTFGSNSNLTRSSTKSLPDKNDKTLGSESEEISTVSVSVRVRPLSASECLRDKVTNVIRVQDNELTVLAGNSADGLAGVTHSFMYDNVFYSCHPEDPKYANQDIVFKKTALPLIDRAFEGYNACLFAYGQTGSGKSYSMMGMETLDDVNAISLSPNPEAGIIPRFCHEIFQRIERLKDTVKVEIEVSYFEIYNEKIHDLLCVSQMDVSGGTPMQQHHQQIRGKPLKVREHPTWGPYIVDLSVYTTASYEALRNWLAIGNSQRATAATGMNEKSSRSHSIFNIVMNITDIDSSDSDSEFSSAASSLSSNTIDSANLEREQLRQTRRSKISLVDLAGSERIDTSSLKGDRMKEGVSINKSLLTLGKVIAALSESKRSNNIFVPYRESVLTWLLKENLGGNSRTCMLATISPANIHIDETLATLRYACQAQRIVNRIKVNESHYDKVIRELKADVDRWKSIASEYERQKNLPRTINSIPQKIVIETSVDDSEVEALRQQLSERERELQRAEKSWAQRLKEAEDQRKSEMRLLKRKGLALELSAEQKQACLVNLSEDPIFSGTLLYLLPPGALKVGRTRTSTHCSQPEIVLDGPLVAYHHCIVENDNGKLYITPETEDYETYVNGELIHGRHELFHGDRLVIGGSHYFRVSNPFCTNPNKQKVVDFQFAHQEILTKQEEKLRKELEEEKVAALARIELERMEHERDYEDRMRTLDFAKLKVDRDRELLETERKVFTVECERRKSTEAEINLLRTPSMKSPTKLFEDINRIMQTPSEESLHKTQLMVKEATERCRNFGLPIEFRHSQVLDEFGIFHTMIIIIDRDHQAKAEWPPARLGVWLNMIRDDENINAKNIFQSVDIDWEPMEAELNQSLNDSLNSSKISLNLSIFKDGILKYKLPKLFRSNSSSNSSPSVSTSASPGSGMDSPSIRSRKANKQQLIKNALINSASPLPRHVNKHLTFDDDDDDDENIENDQNRNQSRNRIKRKPLFESSPPNMQGNCKVNFNSEALECVRDMQRLTYRLKNLCEKAKNERKNTRQNLNARNSLSRPLAVDEIIEESAKSLENTLQRMHLTLENSPTPNRNAGGSNAISPTTKTPKSVRFLVD